MFSSFIVFPQSTGLGPKNASGLQGKNMFDYKPLLRPSMSSTSHKYLPELRLFSQVDCRHRKGHRNFESTSIYAFPCEIKSPVLHTHWGHHIPRNNPYCFPTSVTHTLVSYFNLNFNLFRSYRETVGVFLLQKWRNTLLRFSPKIIGFLLQRWCLGHFEVK